MRLGKAYAGMKACKSKKYEAPTLHISGLTGCTLIISSSSACQREVGPLRKPAHARRLLAWQEVACHTWPWPHVLTGMRWIYSLRTSTPLFHRRCALSPRWVVLHV